MIYRANQAWNAVPYSLRRMESRSHAPAAYHARVPLGQAIDAPAPVIEHVRNGVALTPEGAKLLERASLSQQNRSESHVTERPN